MTGYSQHGEFSVRRTQLSDCRLLPAIERSASCVFASDPTLAWLTEQEPINPEKHAALIGQGLCFVAAYDDDRPCGFIATEVLGLDLHIWELSVELSHQKRGIGRQLIAALAHAAANLRLRQLTLTTFRDLVWNGPFYQSCGFAELLDLTFYPRLAALLESEAQSGLPIERRCAMVKSL